MKVPSDWIFEAKAKSSNFGVCSKCNQKSKLDRHHIGADSVFAAFSYGLTKRYEQFLPEDIDYLCRDCHGKFHKYIKGKIYALIAMIYVYNKLNISITDKLLWSMRNQIVLLYKKWLVTSNKKIKREYKKYHKEAAYWSELNEQLKNRGFRGRKLQYLG